MMLDGYIRVSRVAGREGESFISPDVQREQIEAWAKLRRATIVEWHTDLDMSGARGDRPGLLDAIERVEQGSTGGIVVAKLDRLARSLPVAFDAIHRIEAAGGRVVSVDEGIDPSTVNGRMMRSLLLLLAEWYRDQVRAGWEIAREKAVRRGAAISSTVPTGYRRGDRGQLEPDPQWGPVVRELFERRAEGAAWADLARLMNDRGVPVQYASGRRRGQGRWTGQTVSRLVAGRVYLGEVRHGAFVNLDAHEPLVSASVWHAAQHARGVQLPRADHDPALLSGLVRCAGCGYGMHRSRGRGAGGTTLAGYRCRGGGSGGQCPERAFAYGDALERLVVDEFLRHAADLEVTGSQDTSELDDALVELDDARHALEVFRDDPRVIGALGPDGFATGLQERARRVEQAEAAVVAARLPVAGMPDSATLRRIWPDLDVVRRRRLLAAGIDFVVVAGRGPLTAERVRVCWAGLGPIDVPRRGVRGAALRPIALDGLPAQTRVAFAGEVGEDG
jgi:DNA invertase Pin-like site-specific DNA recombinase